MSGDYASSGYLDDEPAAFARFPRAGRDLAGAAAAVAVAAGSRLVQPLGEETA